MRTERQNFLDVAFDALPVDALVSRIGGIGAASQYQYLVTPNVDHIVRLHKLGRELPEISEAYRRADLCVCDSRILALLARWRGVHLPVIPGSDLTALLFQKVIHAGDRIAVVGGDEAMVEELRAKYPSLEIVHQLPPMGLMRDPDARTASARFIVDQKARFSFICVGSPQQELIAAEAARLGSGRGLALCIGAALEFLTDRQKRAPRLAQRLHLEWAHRLLSNPRRLWRRYLVEGPAIFLLAARWRRSAT